MAPGAVTAWQPATVVRITRETDRARTFRLRPERPSAHLAGQHYVVRLTAPDGYTASRSYSIASAPDGSEEFDLTVERLDGGEVSTFLHDVVEPGDELEVRGPIGGWFVWDGTTRALLIGGGSGIVPLMSMLRLARLRTRADGSPASRVRRAAAPQPAAVPDWSARLSARLQGDDLVRMVVSVRSPDDLYYAAELPGPETTVVYTRRNAPGGLRPTGRLRGSDLPFDAGRFATAYVCGSTGFVNTATDLLIGSGMPAAGIRVERFGPT